MCNAPDAEWRVGPDKTMYCINLTAEEAQAVLAVTEDGARDLFESSVACVGAATCQQGVRDSQSTLKMLVEAMRREGFSDGILPRHPYLRLPFQLRYAPKSVRWVFAAA